MAKLPGAFLVLTVVIIIYIVFHILVLEPHMKFSNLLAVLILLLAGNAMAQPLSLKEAISRSLENNHLLKAAGYSLAAARQTPGIASSGYYPSITFEEALIASNSPTQTFMMKLDQGRFSQNDFQIEKLNNPSGQHDFRTALSVQIPLYVPSLSPLAGLANREAEKSEHEFETARQSTGLRVLGLYLDIHRSQAQLKTVEMALADARENMRLAKVRNAAGVGLYSDELRARSHLSLVEQQLITARNNIALARLQLLLAMDWPENVSFEVSEIPQDVAIPYSDDELADFALKNRPDLKQLRVELEKSEDYVKLAKSDYLPALNAHAIYQLNSKNAPFAADNKSWNAGVSLKWRLFDGFRSNGEVGRYKSARSAARELLDNRVNEIRFQLKESRLKREETGKRLEVARHAQADAEETVRLLAKRYENSLTTMLELLDAQTILNQSRANLVESEVSHLMAAGRLYFSAGIFLKEILK